MQNNNIRTFSKLLDDEIKRIQTSISYADEMTHIMNTRKKPINTDYIKAITKTINGLEASVSNANEISEKMDGILGKIKIYKLLKKQINAKYLTARKTFNNKIALGQSLGRLSANVVRTHYPDSLTSPEKFIASQYLTPESKSPKTKSRGGTRKLKK